MVDSLLDEWREYMQSKEYGQERDRAIKNRPKEEKANEVAAKVKCHQLRNMKRWAQRIQRQSGGAGVHMDRWTPEDRDLYERYRQGYLDEDLDNATLVHGYGCLSSGECLGSVR